MWLNVLQPKRGEWKISCFENSSVDFVFGMES